MHLLQWRRYQALCMPLAYSSTRTHAPKTWHSRYFYHINRLNKFCTANSHIVVSHLWRDTRPCIFISSHFWTMPMDNAIHLACLLYFSLNCKMLRLSAFNKSITYLLTLMHSKKQIYFWFHDLYCLYFTIVSRVVLCDTWNWNDDNDTVSGIAILDTTAIPEMRSAISMSFRIHQFQSTHRP